MGFRVRNHIKRIQIYNFNLAFLICDQYFICSNRKLPIYFSSVLKLCTRCNQIKHYTITCIDCMSPKQQLFDFAKEWICCSTIYSVTALLYKFKTCSVTVCRIPEVVGIGQIIHYTVSSMYTVYLHTRYSNFCYRNLIPANKVKRKKKQKTSILFIQAL